MNKAIVACAGSGKTTYIVKKSLELIDKKVLITTFTDSNVEEIKNKIIEVNGSIPANIHVLPWFTFQLDHLIRPFQLDFINVKIKDVIMKNGSTTTYTSKNKKEYYIKDGAIYSDKIADLAFSTIVNKPQTLERLKLLFDYIFIDEFQDFSGYDLDIVKKISDDDIPIEIVCDPRQHTFSTHYDRKNKKYSSDPLDFIKTKCNSTFEVDETSLNGSFRCPHNTIMYASEIFPEYPLSPSLKEYEKGDGIWFIPESQVDLFLINNINCLQLRDSKKRKVNENFKVSTFGKSKGLTVDNSLIYPTQPMLSAILKSNFQLLSPGAKSDLYVALTRAKHKTGIVVQDKQLKNYDSVIQHIDLYLKQK